MMKKILVLLVVVALALVSSMAFAADVTVGGSMDIRSRDFNTLSLDKNNNTKDNIDTQERVRVDVNVKAGDVKGKITIENDWDTLGRWEAVQGTTTVATGATNTTTGAVTTGKASRLGVREAWMLFKVPDMPFAIKGGHQFLQLGNGWWFRSNKYGSDAWVAISELDKLHLALFDVKVAEGVTYKSDDVDAYGIVATLQATETMKFGVDLTIMNDRKNSIIYSASGQPFGGASTKETQAQNLGLNFNGKVGPVNLQAEVDVQMGKAKGNDAKFKGNQIVIQGSVPVDPVTINFTVARGSGAKATDTDYKEMITFLDADPHYTFLYEYRIATAAGAINTGFSNTTAISAGAMFNATKNLAIGADLWFLQATEKVADVTSTTGATTSEIGTEVDVKINWKLYDNLTWNWTLGYLDPGKGLGKDAATGAQGVLSMKF